MHLTESMPHTMLNFSGLSPPADGVLLLLKVNPILMPLRTREKLFCFVVSVGITG